MKINCQYLEQLEIWTLLLTVFLKEKKSLHSKVNEDKKYTLKIPTPAATPTAAAPVEEPLDEPMGQPDMSEPDMEQPDMEPSDKPFDDKEPFDAGVEANEETDPKNLSNN
jgi:hypothetical protein